MSLPALETIALQAEGRAVFATLSVPPLNFITAQLIRDLTELFEALDESEVRVIVFDSANPDFFLARVDVSDLPQYTAAAAGAGGPNDQWLGTLLRIIAESRVVTIAKIAGRTGGAGSEFALACDMRFASLERASFGQPELGLGLLPGAGALQHLPRLMGRGRALEVILGAQDFDASEAERYGWINRALPDAELDDFVTGLAVRIAGFPSKALRVAKQRINQAVLPDINEVYTDAQWFQKFGRSPQAQARTALAVQRGFNTDPGVERRLGDFLGELPAS